MEIGYWSKMRSKVFMISKLFDDAAMNGNKEIIISVIEYVELLIEKEKFTVLEKFQLLYSLGTAYSDLYTLDSEEKKELIQEKELLNYRKALEIYKKGDLDDITMLPQLYINMGNGYFNVGRVMESIKYYDLAIELVSNHPMAWGCKGKTLEHLARMTYDTGHQDILLYEAYQSIQLALKNKEVYPYQKAIDIFEGISKRIEKHFDIEWLTKAFDFEEYEMGNAKEREYRIWSLENNLFLNELNETVKNSAVAHDPLHLPIIVTELDFDYRLHGFINQIKQDYVSARYIFYKATRNEGSAHFSDKEVYQVNTLDYAIHSLNDFQVKNVFKSAHSIFDKIAYFLNAYYKVGIKEKDIDFNTIWKTENGFNKRKYKYENPIVEKIHENLALKGLYWMAKDFYPVHNLVIAPNSKIIKEIRNHLEHKYVKTVDFELISENSRVDGLAYYLTRNELYNYTLMILKLSRDAILNLIMAVYQEEQIRKKSRGEGITPPVYLSAIKNEWKM
ncbi:LA2681 family HEPN domain-containing protein [Bacillus sp. WOD8 KX774193]|uniref:LA2681 family HEPN domain-containing protein n=1 Tax=Bacillus TaxID=1386 RepID=UPI001456ED31|nr:MULTISPECIES: LA2681 family HEPN domain-containing protein [Bacillus]MDA2629412.1 LA2681 family HEPN domain-containing protein [Bacillus cereus]MEB5653859.1 LA2681 family HEPN domain-containing protein [Bacillus anthracis]MEC3854698.1 LA2681 family HEPN domain-containing protein [Bacillus sp. WOD8 KX774193]